MSYNLYHSKSTRSVAFSSALLAAPSLAEFGGSAHPEEFKSAARKALGEVYRSNEWVTYVTSGAADLDAADLEAGVPVALNRSHPLAKVRSLTEAIELADEASLHGVPLHWS